MSPDSPGRSSCRGPRSRVGAAEATDAYASAPTTIKISRGRFKSAPILHRHPIPDRAAAQRPAPRSSAMPRRGFRRYMLLGHRPDVPGTGRSTQNRRREANSVRGFRRLSAVALATSVAGLFGGDRERRPSDPRAVQAQRLRRLPQRPAAGAGRERERQPDRRPSGQLPAAPARLRKLPPAHQRPPAEDVQEPDVRDAGADCRADPHLLQGRQLRNRPGQRRAHLQPAWRRDDPARQRSAFPTSTAPPAGERCSGPATSPARTACSSSTRSATPAAPSSPPSPAAPTPRWTSRSGPTRPTTSRSSSSSTTAPTSSTGRRA